MNYFIWRPVIEKITTLTEINENWSINDLADAHEALDIKNAIMKESMPDKPEK